MLYSLVQAQPQELPATTHLDWNPILTPFLKELRSFAAADFLTGSHTIGPGGEFGAGFRLKPAFIVKLAVLHDDRTEISKLTEALDHATNQLVGSELRKSINLPITVIDAFFTDYEQRGQGYKSGQIGESVYIPKARPS